MWSLPPSNGLVFTTQPVFAAAPQNFIIGGGNVCARKAETMMKYGGRVTIVSPEFTGEIEEWSRQGLLEIRRKPYEERDLDGAAIVDRALAA